MECVTSSIVYWDWFRSCRKFKLPADEDIDPLQGTFKENDNVKLGEKEDFGDEVIAVVSATSSIFSVTLIGQNPKQ